MQLHKIFLAAAFIGSTITIAQAQQEKKAEEICYNPNAKGDTSKRSIKSAAMGKIGGAAVVINYHSPGVRGRTIWGVLTFWDNRTRDCKGFVCFYGCGMVCTGYPHLVVRNQPAPDSPAPDSG